MASKRINVERGLGRDQRRSNLTISLVIPAHNEEKYIGDCLASVVRVARGKFKEILVVDNASVDLTSQVASKWPSVRVVFERRKGVTSARQRGFENATGDLVAYLDADARLSEGWLEKVINEFSGDDGLVCLSGPYRYHDASFLLRTALCIFWWLTAPISYRLAGYMAVGGNLVVRRRVLKAVGGFNEDISFYGDDTDLARRLSRIGKVIFRMDLFVYTSARRFKKCGLLKTSATYAMNFVWVVLFHTPLTKKYEDIR